jgi:hypothetical protein
MTQGRIRWVAWGTWLLGVVMIVVSAVLTEINPPISTTQPAESAVEGAIWLSTWVGFGLVGALIVSSRPRNRIGWIMCGITLAIGFDLFVGAYSTYALVTDPGRWPLGMAAAWVATWAFFPVVLLVAALVILYPSGVASRFGYRVFQALLAVVSLAFIVYAFRPGPVRGDTPPENPLGIPGIQQFTEPASEWLGTLLAAVAIVAVVDLVLRYRRSVGVERLQFRWFVLAVVAFPIMFLGAVFLEETVLGTDGFDPVVLAFALWGNGTAAAIGIAITRHGLFEIDRIVSRTVSYAIVITLLALVYVGGLAGLTTLLDTDSPLAVAGSTLAVAALFNPLRHRVQSLVDHRFNRSRYDAQRVMDRFTGSLRDEVDPDLVVGGWMSVVNETMKPAASGIWLRGAS